MRRLRRRREDVNDARGTARDPVYLATALPGLEEVAADEVRAKVEDAAIRQTARGKVFFTSRQPFERLLALRSVDNLYTVAGRFRVGPHRAHLVDVEEAVASLDVGEVVARASAAPPHPTCFVNASRSGRHTYSRFELAEAATQGILARCPRWRIGSADDHDLEFRLDVADETAVFSLRLTPPGFRFRGQERRFALAALRPPVAHALVWRSRPAPDDRFADPFCGSGTILAERLPYPARRVLGGDLAPEALAAARANLPADPRLTLARWDARRLPLAAGSVDKVVSNLPFGRQVLAANEIAGLYRGLAAEVGRVLAPGGHALLLTDQMEALTRAAEAAGLRSQAVLSLSLKGRHPQVILLRRE
ncbi:MAG: methyltransferase domain-containing protein [Chloroflexota bacterium]